MRPFASAVFVCTLFLHSLSYAQGSQPVQRDDRLFLRGGYGRTRGFGGLSGLHLGAEYSLTAPGRVVGLRVHVATFWTPTQSYSFPSILYGPGARFQGSGQDARVDVGLTGSITPWPRAPFSPYVVGGIVATQGWVSGSGAYVRPDGTAATGPRTYGGTAGQFALVTGYGFQLRMGRQLWRLEARSLAGLQSTYSVGTSLRF